jgi:hypothetical protein
MISIAAVSAVAGDERAANDLKQLASNPLIGRVASANSAKSPLSGTIRALQADELWSATAVVETLRWFESTNLSHLLWSITGRANLAATDVRRLVQVATDTGAALLYSDFFDEKSDGTFALHPLIDYQLGSVRDDFDFGHAVLLNREAVRGLAETIEAEKASSDFAGWYDLRLRLSERGPIVHLSEPTYSARAVAEMSDEVAHFNYVDPRNRNYQIEMEKVATAHLKRIGAWLPPATGNPVKDDSTFPVECSVVIPVRNRVRTVGDAVQSALSQKTYFSFNVVVVDNHSTDGTFELLQELAAKNQRLVHLVPERRDLGIGGCWSEAIFSKWCGKYAVQLDSDDIYSSEDVLARVLAVFKQNNCAAVVGSYTIVDSNLKQIPPGLIDHREWTDENGHNNVIRIHGLGAPRAFHVPTLRQFGFPNTSYGEDYAVMIRLCREYRIGRIYDSLYWCRRWEGNSDHALPLDTQNRYAFYKDRLRTIELAARQQLSAR